MIVAKISQQKAFEIKGQTYDGENRYNPILDQNGNYVVSLVEAQYLALKDLELIEFKPLDKTT